MQTKRDYLHRMVDDKVHCMKIAKQYEYDYWDGDRRYGYGGYKYIPGRWKKVAEQLIKIYGLDENSSILDVGCGKGFLLYEIKLLLPNIKVLGIDISEHGLKNSKKEIMHLLKKKSTSDLKDFENNKFDLVISLGTLHNMKIFDLEIILKNINRISKNQYIMVESYRNNLELFNLQCWALTAESFLEPEEWLWLFEVSGYNGDYEFIYFE